MSFDGFEHILNYLEGLKECFRVLKPTGRLLFTVPFRVDAKENIVGAEVKTTARLNIFYHPSIMVTPSMKEGRLYFYHLGWALLKDLKTVRFQNPLAHPYWSDHFGYLGRNQVVFSAGKDTTNIELSRTLWPLDLFTGQKP